jgi:hypothetical protein
MRDHVKGLSLYALLWPLNRGSQACLLLSSLFPAWDPLPYDSEECAVCEIEAHMAQQTRLELRKQAEEEKVWLSVLLLLVLNH